MYIYSHPIAPAAAAAALAAVEMLDSPAGLQLLEHLRTLTRRFEKGLVDLGLAESRHKAQALILAGSVFFSEGVRVEKPGQRIQEGQEVYLKKRMPFVGRGGLKLNEALEAFDLDVRDRVAADLGASTGGFTDCLLQRGAKKVYAVDVDTRQLDWKLTRDPRVIPIKKNARYLDASDFKDGLDIITADVSFFSSLKIFPAIKAVLGDGEVVVLIKSTMEVGRHQFGEKVMMKDQILHMGSLEKVAGEAGRMGLKLKSVFKTSVRGQKGNQEYFVLCKMSTDVLADAEVLALIKEAVWNEK